MSGKIRNKSKHEWPQYGNEYAAGMDHKSNRKHPIILKSLEPRLIHTGLYIELPFDMGAQIRVRNGLVSKTGISMINANDTIDTDYRGIIKGILVNMSTTRCVLKMWIGYVNQCLTKKKKGWKQSKRAE